jgi:hypothetical protein
MQYPLCRKVAATIVLVVGLCTNSFAQARLERSIVLEIDALTPEQRDAVARQLKQDGRYRIAFACAPAGILILEPASITSAWDAAAAKGLVRTRISTNAIRSSMLDRRSAEARCAEARTR